MTCYACGRRLLRAAATVEEHGCTGHLGPACARRLGLLPPRVRRPRLFELAPRKRKAESGQMELVA